MLNILDIGASGLTAQRMRLNAIAGNIANVDTIKDENGRNIPYQRRFVMLKAGLPSDPSKPGVTVSGIEKDQTAYPRKWDPGNPLAKDGYVLEPNVDLPTEFVNALDASRVYDANITMMETTKSMFSASLRLLA